MNVKTQILLKNNNKQNNEYLNLTPNYLQHQKYEKISNKNKFQSDRKLKTYYSPYYKNINKLIKDSNENQKILLKKRELEIKDLKIKCQKLEQENYNYQMQNIILKNNFNKSNTNKFNNNTSSNFPIRNEIKRLWENFAKIELLNNFIDFENEPEIIYHLISELILLSDKMIKEHCLLKYQEIIKIMGMKNNSCIIKDLQTQFKKFMKEHLNEIFNYLKDKSFIDEYKSQYKDIIKKTKDFICKNENNIKIFEEILEQNEFSDMLKNINDIILFTQFNEPTLYFKIEKVYENRKIKFIKINNDNKKEYIIVNEQGNSNSNNNAIFLLEPPCLKSGHSFYKELRPILMLIEKEIKEGFKNDKDYKDLKINKTNNDFLSNEKNNYDNNLNSEITENKIKFNTINNTSRNNKYSKLDLFSKNRKIQYNYINLYTNDSKDNFININKDSFFEEKIKIKNVIFINSTKPFDKRSKKLNNLSISKDVNSDNKEFYSTDENNSIKNNHIKDKQVINIRKKRYNKIYRIKSANSYFDKYNKKRNNEKNKIIKQKTDLIKKEKIIKIFNKYKNYINNDFSSDSKKDIKSTNSKKTLSNDKNFQKPLNFKKYINIKNRQVDYKNYNFLRSNKTIPKNYNNKKENKLNIINFHNSANNTYYKNSFSILNRIKNKDIFYPSNTKKIFKNRKNSKENLVNEIVHKNKKNILKNIINHKNKKIRKQNIKINYKNYICNSNRNILKNKNINQNYYNLSMDRKKSNTRRIDSFEQKSSFIYSTFEEIRKIINDTHSPVILITTNSNINHNNININNKHSKIKIHTFNKKNINKSLGRKNNYKNQIISFPKKKFSENECINYNSFRFKGKKKLNKNTNSFIQNNHNNKGIFSKQLSIDETTFNTSSQFNLTHDYNSKSNKNENNCIKITENKDSILLSKEIINTKSKLSHNNNLNFISNKISEKNIDRENTNKYISFYTIENHSDKKQYHKYLNSFEKSNNEL